MKQIADWDGDRRKISGQLTVSAKLFSLLNLGLARNPAERNFETWASILDAKNHFPAERARGQVSCS
jgi:hypothetical protein